MRKVPLNLCVSASAAPVADAVRLRGALGVQVSWGCAVSWQPHTQGRGFGFLLLFIVPVLVPARASPWTQDRAQCRLCKILL